MTDASYLLDTDIISYYIRDSDPSLAARLRFTPQNKLFVSAISAAELLHGIKRFPPIHSRRIAVELFLDAANVLDWTFAAAEAYAEIRHMLATSGDLIGELDMMIAAHALSAGLVLVSNNTRHHGRLVPPLQLENWTKQ